MDIQKELDIARELLKKFDGKKLILFGSHADGSADESSDIDLAVDMNPTFFWRYYVELEEKINKNVDLVLLSTLSEKFKNRIESKGIGLFNAPSTP